MGLLKQNYNKYNKEYLARGGKISESVLQKWFGKKRAVKRSESILDGTIEFGLKSAVVIVGASGIGKSTFANKFMEVYPGFNLCSHDQFYYQATENMVISSQKDKEYANSRAVDLLEKHLRNLLRKDANLLFEGLYVNPGFRAAILNLLETFGYTVYIICFTSEYTDKVLLEYSKKRAVELSFFQDYLTYEKKPTSLMEIMSVRDRIMEYYSEKLHMPVQKIYAQYIDRKEILRTANALVDATKNEMVAHYFHMQEASGAFAYGADYYFEITEEQ